MRLGVRKSPGPEGLQAGVSRELADVLGRPALVVLEWSRCLGAVSAG